MYRRIEVRPVSGALGAELAGVDLRHPLDDETFAEVRRAFLENLVIFIKDQNLTPEQHKAFAHRFGALDDKPFTRPLDLKCVPGQPEILEIVKDEGDRGINFGGVWHSDVTYRERPNLGSVIYAREVPEAGGDTMFANQYLAYEGLSEGMRRTLDGMKAVHSARRTYEVERFAERYKVDPAAVTVHGDSEREPEARSEVEHPVVRTHPETGRLALYVNRSYTVRFAGMTEGESAPLLAFLFEHAVRPEFTCRYRWQPGSLGLWDNRCTMHYALNDYHGRRRVMHRIAIHGDRPA